MRYFANSNTQPNGDHEVHREGCDHMPLPVHHVYLGNFTGCREAVQAAKQIYPQSNGCYWCSKECHTA